jgi:putative FmdB family regulatory protein
LMPVYEFECDVCGLRFSQRRSFGDPYPDTCPNGHESIHRIFVPPAIIFKGSGFYSTDHGRNGRTSRSSTDSSDSSPPEKNETETKTQEEKKE